MLRAKDRCIFVGNAQSVFVTRTRDRLVEAGIGVEIVDTGKPIPGLHGQRPTGIVRVLRRMHDVWSSLRRIPSSSSAVLHSLSPHIVWLAPLLAIRFPRVVLICYGSDVLRRSKKYDPALKFGLLFVDEIATTNDNIRKALLQDFHGCRRKKCRILRFGLPVLDEIDRLEFDQAQAKAELGLNPDKFCVALGYAAAQGQRQLELIEFVRACAQLFTHIQFIVPCQYGDPDHIAAVRLAVTSLRSLHDDIDIQVFDTFFDARKSALMRRATDVLVNHSISDAFSGTVSEVLYAGNLVLAARHLDYSSMPGSGEALKSYEDLSGMASSLSFSNLLKWKAEAEAELAHTRKMINALCSWQNVIPDWTNFIFSTHRADEAVAHY